MVDTEAFRGPTNAAPGVPKEILKRLGRESISGADAHPMRVATAVVHAATHL